MMSKILGMRQFAVFLSTVFVVLSTMASAAFALPPSFSASYSPNNLGPGGTSTLTYTINNAAEAVPATDLAFTHSLPANVTLATPASAATTCSLGTLTAVDGGGTVTYTTGRVAAGASCTVTVNVTSSTVGGHDNSTGDLTSSAGNSGPAATNTLTVATTAPGFTQSFSPSSVTSGGVSKLTYIIDNTANTSGVSTLSFTDSLTTGLTIASPANATTTCGNATFGATFTAAAGTSEISLFANGFLPSFPALAAGASCIVSVDVTSSIVGTHTNTSGALSTNAGSSGTSTAALEVTGVAAGLPLITKSFTNDPVNPGGTVTLDYTITNTDRNFAATAVAFTEDLTATLAGVTFASELSNSCGGTVGGGSTTSINFTGGTIAAQSSCTISVSLSLLASAAGGTHMSTSGAVSATVNGAAVVGNMASDNLNVQLGGGAPTVALSMTSGNPNGTTVATYTVTNASSTSSLTGLAFVTDFPADVISTASVTPGNDLCGAGSTGTFTPLIDDPNGTVPARLSVSGGNLAPAGMAGDSCTFMITLNIGATAPTGPHTVTTSAPTSTVGGAVVTSSAASFDLIVGAGGGNLAVRLEKAFSVASALPNEVIGLTYVITNEPESTGTATNISFTDPVSGTLPGATLTSVTSNNCGATVVGDGAGTITVTGGSRDIGASCTIGATITLGPSAPGDIMNQTSGVSAGLAGGTAGVVGSPASADLSVNGFLPLTFTQSFTDDPVIAGDTVTLEYTINNPNPATDATGMVFTHNFGAVISGITTTGALPVNPCGAGSSLTGTTFLIFVGGNIIGGDSCTFSVTLQVPGGAANNSYGSVTSNLSATIGGIASTGVAASDSLVVNNANILFSKSFTNAPVFAGTAATLEFTLQNTNATTAITGIGFTDDLDAMTFKNLAGGTLTGTTLNSVPFNDCGATVGGTGTSLITVTGGSLAAGATCNIRVSMTPPGATASGSYTNTTSAASGMISGLAVTGDAATANLQVFSTGSPTFSKSFAGPVHPNDTTQLSFTIANPGASTIINLAFTDDLSAVLAGLTATSLPASPCGAGSSISGTGVLTFSGGTLPPGASCTFNVNVTAPNTATAGNYPNTTSDLTSGGIKLADPATASLTVEPAPTFAKAFGPASVAQGAPSTLTFTINNTASSLAATSLAFTDTFPAGLVVAATPNASTTCTGGTVTADAGTGSVGYTGGTVAAGASCTLVANVTAAAVNVYNNTSGALTSNAGSSGTAAASLNVTAAPLPAFSKAFGGTIVQGATTTLAFTINNTALVDATALAFTDNMPAAVKVATTPSVTNTCTGGTVNAVAGTSLISYTGGAVGASSNCIITVNVTSDVAGPHNNISGALTSSLGASSTANASLTVTAAPSPAFSKAFTAGTIAQGGVDTLTFTINNTGALIDATGLSFSDTFPAGMVIAPTANNSSTCTGGMGAFTPGANNMSYAGGTVAKSASCTVSFDVTSATVGPVTNTSSTLASSLGVSTAATANFTVTSAPLPTFSKAFTPNSVVEGGITKVIYTINNTALIPATGMAFNDGFLPAPITVAAVPNAANTCGGTLTATAGSPTLFYAGGTLAASSNCTISVDMQAILAGNYPEPSLNLITSLGDSGNATDTLTVTDAPVPTFSKAFTAGTIVQGGVDTLTFTINNGAALIDATALDFSDTFPAGMIVAATPNASTTCTVGAITATAGAGLASYAGGTVGAGATCTISVDVTSATVGALVNTSGALASSLGASGTATDTLTVTAAPIPTLSKAFGTPVIEQGGVSTLTFTVNNNTALVGATLVSFSDTFPAGMVVANAPSLVDNCRGTLIANAGDGSITYSGGQVPISSSCTILVDVTSAAIGPLTNITSTLSSSLGVSGTATDTLTVTAAAPPTFSKAFNPSSIVQGGISTLTFTVNNPTALIDITALDFSDTFPVGMTVAATPNASTTCTGGAITATAGAGLASYAGGTVGAGATCTISVDVTSATLGVSDNTSGALTSSQAASGTANAQLTVTVAPTPTFSKAFTAGTIVQGGVDTLTFTINNGTALVEASGLTFSDTFPTGMIVAATPNASTTCTGGAITAAAGAGLASYASGTVGAGAICTISVDVTSATVGALVNTSGALASSLGASGTATDTLTVTGAATPTFSKAFTAGTIVQGGVDTLTFTINNGTALVEASGLTFSDTFPTGMIVAATPNASTTCTGGAITAAAGAGLASYAGGTVGAGAICTISVDVTSATVGASVNTSGALNSSLGASGTATDTLTVTGAAAPTFSKAFTAGTIVQGGVDTLTFTINNGTALVDATALAFSDTFPTGMIVAATPNASTTCTGGAITATAGAGLASYAGGTVGAGAICTISVDVTSATADVLVNTSGALNSSLGASGTATDTLTVTGAAAPTFSKAFTAGTIVQGGVDTLTFTINNGTALVDATALAFSDTFPTGMIVAATPNASTTCTGGAITATAGAGLASYAGGTVGAGAICTISVDVTSATVGASVNTSGALASSLGASGTATDTLTVTGAAAPTFSIAFAAGTIVQGGVDTLTYTVNNTTAFVDVTGLTFSDTFPTGMTVAATPNASTTCTGGTITATAGAGLVSYTGGTVGAGATCTITVDITSATVGALASRSVALSSSLGSSVAANTTTTFTVTPSAASTFSKTFNPSSIVQGGTSTLTFTVDNSSVLVDATSLAFSDTFPAGMTVAATPNASTTCTGGAITATAGAGLASYAGGTVGASATCTISVDVTSATVGNATNSSGDLTSSLGNSGPSSATLSVTTAPTPNFSMAFSPSTIVQDATSTLTFTVDNRSSLVDATGLTFNNVFPAGMTVAATKNARSTCGGTLSANAGSNAIGFSGGTATASNNCTVAVDITSNIVGALVNTANALNTSLGTSARANATLTVTANPIGQVTIVQISDTDSTFGFSSTEGLLNFNISTLSGSGTRGPISLTAGTYVIAQSRPDGFGNASLKCTDANSIGVSATGDLTLNLEARESVTCTYTSVDSVTPTKQAINDFLNRRITQILSSEPSNGRRIGRLKGKFGGTQIVSFTHGDLRSLMPVNFDLKTLGSGNYNISGSLSQAKAAIVRHPLSLDGSTDGTAEISNSRFDVWFEASYNRFKGSQGSKGHFGIGYLGADYLYSKDLLIGFLVQFDDIEDRSLTLNKTVSGTGWMAGPYVTARLSPNLYFDGRFAIGRSNNFLDLDLNNTTGLASGNFDTSRWLVDASLVGDVDLGKWQMQPNLSLSYMEESQKAFVDSLNVSQPGQTVSQGQIRIGPNFSTRIENDNGTVFEPTFTFDGIFSFGNSAGTLATSTADETDGLRGRVEAGVTIATRKNVRVELSFNYDGIGKSDYESYGTSLKFVMPF